MQIQPDMITIDTAALGKVDKKSVEDAMEEKKKRMVGGTCSLNPMADPHTTIYTSILHFNFTNAPSGIIPV